MHNVDTYEDRQYKNIPLQWIDGSFISEEEMFNRFSHEMTVDDRPVCPFKTSLFERSLHVVNNIMDVSLTAQY